MKQFFSFVRKEFIHIFRDRRTMLILLVMPVILMVLFGYAITTEVKNSRIVVVDFAHDAVSRRLTDRIDAGRYFDVVHRTASVAEAEALFREGRADAAVVFPARFADDAVHARSAEVQILADGSEPNQAAMRVGYLGQILASAAAETAEGGSIQKAPQIRTVVRMLYNPQAKSEYNFVPGVIGMILLLICAMMTSIAIVREKEQGTMEVLLASPLHPLCIVLAKLVPYFVISCANLVTILLLSRFLLHIPLAGSVVGFFAVSLLYIIVALLLGLFISTLVGSQLAAMLLSLLLIMPSLYLSGLAFPLESMPAALQRASAVVPARWYIEAARKLMIQGVEMRCVVRETVVLGGMAVVLLGVSWKLFKTRL